jgi:hypothetical protein
MLGNQAVRERPFPAAAPARPQRSRRNPLLGLAMLAGGLAAALAALTPIFGPAALIRFSTQVGLIALVAIPVGWALMRMIAFVVYRLDDGPDPWAVAATSVASRDIEDAA